MKNSFGNCDSFILNKNVSYVEIVYSKIDRLGCIAHSIIHSFAILMTSSHIFQIVVPLNSQIASKITYFPSFFES